MQAFFVVRECYLLRPLTPTFKGRDGQTVKVSFLLPGLLFLLDLPNLPSMAL